MEITEVRIKLMEDQGERLCAFCSITFDGCFVIRDLKVIKGSKGEFVAMPSRKLTDRCPKCHFKNHLRASFCNQCGVKLKTERVSKDPDGRSKLYADIAHPINSECRDLIQQTVIAAYHEEMVKAKEEGYICTYDDYGENDYSYDEDYHPGDSGQYSSPNKPVIYSENHEGKIQRVDPESSPTAHKPNEQQHGERSATEKFGDGIIQE